MIHHTQRPLPIACFAAALLLSLPAFGQQADLMASAEREIVRRQDDLDIAKNLIPQGEKAEVAGDYETAYVSFLDALDKIPASAPTKKLRDATTAQFSRVAIKYAEQLIANGRYGDAERVAKTILLPQYDPGFKPAMQLLSNLEQPDYYNKTVTPEFAAKRDEVNKLLSEAEAFFQTGRFDLSAKRYEQVLNIDRYNTAARKGLEQVALERSKYQINAYNETRSRMLWQVDRSWERPVRKFQGGRSTEVVGATSRNGVRGTEAITAKLNRIVIPRIDLRDTTVREAVEYLKQQSRLLDQTGDDAQSKRGVNIVLKLDEREKTSLPAEEGSPAAGTENQISENTGGSANTTVTLSLTNIPLIEAIKYVTKLARLKYKIEPYAVSIVPITENTSDLVTKEYRVPPGFIPQNTQSTDTTSGLPGVDLATDKRIGSRTNALDYLQSQGVSFPTGSFAQYVPAGSKLIVRNTPDSIDLIDSLVDAATGVQPTQVEIESKFIEISQNNLKELGFDWLLGPLSIGGGVYGSGGTVGYGTNDSPTSVDSSNYSFVDSSGNAVGQNPVTSGLRSGTGNSVSSAITANGIDSLLGAVTQGVAPGILGISGVFTNPQFQVVIRALNQKKGVDLMSAPKVTTKSGRKAIVRVVREFPYPTEFNPPEPPPPAQGTTTVELTVGSITSQGIVTPSTPTAFETRNLGVTLEVEPIIGPDGFTIDLNLSPEVVEFEGFVNYGSPILGPAFSLSTMSISTEVLTPNVINQPIFSTRKVSTSVSVWDGQTVALGGLIREDVQKVQDKIPLLGDIPLAGRLFRSDVDQKIKRNLIIFVTARILDAEGRPIRNEVDTEEIVDPLGTPEDLPSPLFNEPGFGK